MGVTHQRAAVRRRTHPLSVDVSMKIRLLWEGAE
jgi:hypothetical protein